MMVVLILGIMGQYTIAPTFWPLPTAMLSGVAAAGGIALINAVGNLGGFLGPYMFGLIKDATGGSDLIALLAIGAAPVISAIVLVAMGHDSRLERIPHSASPQRSRRVRPIASTWWQATCTSPSDRSAGRSATHSSVAYGQREANTQPAGGSIGEGGSPFTATAALRSRRIQRRRRRQQHARIRMPRRREHASRFGPCSTARPQIHHQHVVGDVAHHRQVVADEQIGQVELVLQVHHQVQHLRLDRHVQRRDRFVRHHDARVAASGRGRWRCAGAGRPRTCADNGRTGPAAARPCAIIARAAASPRVPVAAMVDRQRFLQDRAHRLARIERAIRVLEHHLHATQQPAAFGAARRRVGSPSISRSPAVGGSSSVAMRASVDLPQPDSPTTASVCPALSANETPSTALHRRPCARTCRAPTR